MSLVKISSKGQITIPAKIRTFLGVEAKDKLELIVRDNAVVIQPVRPFKNLRGSVAYKQGEPRKVMEEAVAKHVLEASE